MNDAVGVAVLHAGEDLSHHRGEVVLVVRHRTARNVRSQIRKRLRERLPTAENKKYIFIIKSTKNSVI